MNKIANETKRNIEQKKQKKTTNKQTKQNKTKYTYSAKTCHC